MMATNDGNNVLGTLIGYLRVILPQSKSRNKKREIPSKSYNHKRFGSALKGWKGRALTLSFKMRLKSFLRI